MLNIFWGSKLNINALDKLNPIVVYWGYFELKSVVSIFLYKKSQ